MTKQKQDGFNIKINPEEREIIRTLQEKHAINISQLFKNFLRQTLNKMEDNKNE